MQNKKGKFKFKILIMLLKEVIINGFKSFANRTKIELGPGVTTIVGPNGCGKSNVVDAIRWVLGEQSAKALRGGTMQDVIFSGTDQRPALNICEVSLLFTDCEKELGTAFNEVEIIRRVTRDGSSNYYLNGKTCRLKDIQELFMNTGVGRVSYSFMVQGQIDQILSTNPAERRVIFEEAAGVTRYKSQRREALNKLSQVDLNLSRVQVVIDEVGRQMASLKRQASKAIRYKKIKHRMSHLDLAFSGYEYQKNEEIINTLDEKVNSLREKVEELQSKQAFEEEEVIEKKAQQSQIFETLQSMQQQIFDLKSKKDKLENRGKLALGRKNDIINRIAEIEKELKVAQKQIEELEVKAKDNHYFKQLQLNLVTTSDETFKEKNESVEALQKKLLEAEQELQNKKKEFLKVEGEGNRLRIKSNELEVALNTHNNQVADLNSKKLEGEAHHEELTKQLENLQKTLTQQEEIQKKTQEDFKEAQLLVIKRTEGLKDLQKNIQEQDRQVARMNAQVAALEGLQSRFEGFSDGAKAILQGKLGETLEKGDYGLLSKWIELDEVYMKAFETLLGQAMDVIALEEMGQVVLLTQKLEEKDLGRACFNIEIKKKIKKPENGNLPPFLKRAEEVITIKEGKFKTRWERLLEGCYFAENLDEFIEFWQNNPEFDFQLITTRKGELIDARGLIYGGVKKGKNEGSGFLQREKEIRECKENVDEQKKILENLLNKGKNEQAEVKEAEERLEVIRKKANQENEKILGLKAEDKQLKIAIDRDRGSINRTMEQLSNIQKVFEESQSKLSEGVMELEKIQGKMESLKKEILLCEEKIVMQRQERDEQREILAEMRVDLAERRQKLQMLDEGLSENEHRKKELAQNYTKKERELHSYTDQIQELKNEAENCELEAAELQKSLILATTSMEKEREGFTVIENEIKGLDLKLASGRKELQTQETTLKNDEVELAKKRSQIHFMVEKILSEYECNLDDVNWKKELWIAKEEFESQISLDEIEDVEELILKSKKDHTDPTEADLNAMDHTNWEEIQKEVKTLREKLNSMGGVNLVAIEEYAEHKERFEFLEKQCNDLKSAKEQLLQAIEEINTKSQALFKDTFEKVKENFKYTFDALFGGGVADLELIETEDVLEAGIEIIARPPGTKLRSLSLLSGGQKTMTAVALLFAIYKVKPSPFCVLDELDAPLDDANIGRFTNMLREFTKYSQFLVISHNRRTIAASDTLYGVTMQVKGVTSLISMRFNKKDNPVPETIDELIEPVAAISSR